MLNKKETRRRFREGCFERDSHRCRVCKSSGKLDAHHITDRNEMPNGGYVLENGISLCEDCHMKAERWHISGNTDFVKGYHPDELYAIIGSSHQKALRASERLG
jgi:5-methylcytosine-specific restriction endonuclease McrA